MPNFMWAPWWGVVAGKSRDRLDGFVEPSEQGGSPLPLAQGEGEATAGHEQLPRVATGPRARQQLGREQRVVPRALVIGDGHGKRRGEEGAVGQVLLARPHVDEQIG